MKKQFLSLLTLLVVCVTGAWGDQTDLIDGVTLPDMPTTALDMSSQTFKTPDANGWIVMQPNADIRNASVTWFTALAWNTTDVSSISLPDGCTAPFFTISEKTAFTTVQKGARTKAIRFIGAEKVSFLCSGASNSRCAVVSLFRISNEDQILVETKSTSMNSNYEELLWGSLNTSTEYVAYMYGDNNNKDGNSIIAEIALKKPTVVCPSGLTISGTDSYAVGEDIELTASLSAGNGDITYQWYKGGTESSNAIDGETSTTLTISSCELADAGNYYCIASKTTCDDAVSSAFTVTVSAPACPSGLTITGDDTYTEGNDIELTASLGAGNGEITYQWYKGGTDPANALDGETETTLTISSCELADAGNYYCIASKATCDDAVSAAFAVTVNELPTCYAFYPATSGDAPSENEVIRTSGSSFGGIMQAVSGSTLNYTTYGLSFESSSSTKVNITLKNKMKAGTIIMATLWSNNTGSARTLKLNTSGGNTKATWSFTPASSSGEEKVFTYKVAESDGLINTNVLQLQRGSNVYLRSLIVKNGGDEYAEPIVLTADAWTTFSPSFDVTIPSGVTAYKLAYAGGESATASSISETKIKAAEGVLLKASEAGVYQFVKTTGATELGDNILKGTTERTLVSSLKTKENFYAFDKTDSKFKLYTGEYFPANKAYFETGATLAPSAIRIEFEENGATDIKSVEEKETAVKFFDGGRILIMKNGVVYDALGRVIR